MARLTNGEQFPVVTAESLDHGTLTVPSDLGSEWVTLLFYRGEWWAFCRQQLADFQEHYQQLRDLGLEVAALSVDPEEDARTIADDLGLDFPVLYGLDCQAQADKIGAYYDEEGEFFHATGFLLEGGSIRQATYSSGPIGRFVAEDAAGIVELYQS